MTTVIWLTGKTCVGKSTWAKEQVAASSGVKLVSTGELCRRLVGEEKMALDDQPVTPAETEGVVRGAVQHALQALGPGEVLIIDSMPRSPEQVKWVEDVVSHSSATHVVYYCGCSDDERRHRIAARSVNEKDKALIERRLQVEDAVFVNVLEALLSSDLALNVIDMVTRVGKDARGQVRETDLEFMFAAHEELNDEALVRFGISSDSLRLGAQVDNIDPMSNSAVWTRRFLQAAKKEIDEALECLPEKWWTVDKADLKSCRVEQIDIWHFLMSAAIASGMSGREFAMLYYEKRKLNLARWRSGGYSSKKTAKDDAHLGTLNGSSVI